MGKKKWQGFCINSNLVLADGTTVRPDGTVKMKDGTTTMMNDGDYFKMDGTKGNTKRDKNALPNKMGTDTTK